MAVSNVICTLHLSEDCIVRPWRSALRLSHDIPIALLHVSFTSLVRLFPVHHRKTRAGLSDLFWSIWKRFPARVQLHFIWHFSVCTTKSYEFNDIWFLRDSLTVMLKSSRLKVVLFCKLKKIAENPTLFPRQFREEHKGAIFFCLLFYLEIIWLKPQVLFPMTSPDYLAVCSGDFSFVEVSRSLYYYIILFLTTLLNPDE